MNTHTLVGGQRLVGVHSQSKCAGRPCTIHNPSEHHMADWPQNWRSDRKLMERICEHGVGHPDPDDPSTDTVHGCDFCCTPTIREAQEKINRAVAEAVVADLLVGRTGYAKTWVEDYDAEYQPVGYDGFGTPLYAHQIASRGAE